MLSIQVGAGMPALPFAGKPGTGDAALEMDFDLPVVGGSREGCQRRRVAVEVVQQTGPICYAQGMFGNWHWRKL